MRSPKPESTRTFRPDSTLIEDLRWTYGMAGEIPTGAGEALILEAQFQSSQDPKDPIAAQALARIERIGIERYGKDVSVTRIAQTLLHGDNQTPGDREAGLRRILVLGEIARVGSVDAEETLQPLLHDLPGNETNLVRAALDAVVLSGAGRASASYDLTPMGHAQRRYGNSVARQSVAAAARALDLVPVAYDSHVRKLRKVSENDSAAVDHEARQRRAQVISAAKAASFSPSAWARIAPESRPESAGMRTARRALILALHQYYTAEGFAEEAAEKAAVEAIQARMKQVGTAENAAAALLREAIDRKQISADRLNTPEPSGAFEAGDATRSSRVLSVILGALDEQQIQALGGARSTASRPLSA